jgi:hypothetical protein
MKDFIIVLNSFVHDVATGFLISAAILMGIVDAAASSYPLSREFVAFIMARLFLLSLVSLLVIILTGAGRSIAFRLYGWTGEAARERKKILVVKHAMLGLAFLGAVLYQWQIYSRWM